MVLPSEGENMAKEDDDTSNNTSPLNFRWGGTQRYLRCVSVESEDQNLRSRSSRPRIRIRFRSRGGSNQRRSDRNQRSETEPSRSAEKDGIGELREMIMSDLRTESVKITESIFNGRALEDKESNPPEREVSPATEVRTCNLRKRRETGKAPVLKTGESSDGGNQNKAASSKRRRFTATLTKKEIEDDFVEMTGHKPPKRFKKRSKAFQNQINMLYPAFYLSEITQDLYNVPEAKDKRKR